MRCGILTLRQGNVLRAEPYNLHQFARQFCFDQLAPGHDVKRFIFNLFGTGRILGTYDEKEHRGCFRDNAGWQRGQDGLGVCPMVGINWRFLTSRKESTSFWHSKSSNSQIKKELRVEVLLLLNPHMDSFPSGGSHPDHRNIGKVTSPGKSKPGPWKYKEVQHPSASMHSPSGRKEEVPSFLQHRPRLNGWWFEVWGPAKLLSSYARSLSSYKVVSRNGSIRVYSFSSTSYTKIASITNTICSTQGTWARAGCLEKKRSGIIAVLARTVCSQNRVEIQMEGCEEKWSQWHHTRPTGKGRSSYHFTFPLHAFPCHELWCHCQQERERDRQGEVRVREEKKGCQGRKKKYPIETIDHVVPGVKYRTWIYLFFILCPD